MNPIDDCAAACNLEWLHYALELRRRARRATGIQRSFHVIHARRRPASHYDVTQRLPTFAISL